NHQIHIDPGPGALIRCKDCGILPFNTDCLMATHHHLDHINDLNMMIEGMTRATNKKRGTLIATKSVINDVLNPYHRALVEKTISLMPDQNTSLNGIRIKAVKCVHSAQDTVGFKFYTKDYCLYYTGDTYVYPGFEENLKDVDYLIANNLLPENRGANYHMCTNDLISALKNSNNNIKLIVLTHFDLMMIRAGPENEAKIVTVKTGINCVAAKDSMILRLG
ncbi:MAG: MBL fold metallo-hydrolase, partial [Candidatus Nanoarchaeia archaeon]|nr:MBL fold metallo-hydrolase [Candidatus Nanoarchaeia archaeon]